MSFDFGWKDDYAIGIDEIDSQHKRFLSLIEQIHDINLKHMDDKDSKLSRLIEELENYLVFHTKSEELFMILYSYPKQDKQKLEHAKVLEQVRKKIDRLPQQPEDLADLLVFLMKWFVSHTTFLDKDLGEFINQKRSA